jgi:xanthine dehydrogenase small subunit
LDRWRRGGRRKGAVPARAVGEIFLISVKKDLAPGEFVVGVQTPSAGRSWLASYKVSKRIEQDIAAVSATFSVTVEAGIVRASATRLLCGMAAVPARAPRRKRCCQAKPGRRSR